MQQYNIPNSGIVIATSSSHKDVGIGISTREDRWKLLVAKAARAHFSLAN